MFNTRLLTYLLKLILSLLTYSYRFDRALHLKISFANTRMPALFVMLEPICSSHIGPQFLKVPINNFFVG